VVYSYWNSLNVRGCLPYWLSFLEVVFPGGCLPNFKNCSDLYWSRPTNVTKQVVLISCYFTTIPGGRVAGQVAGQTGGRVAGLIKIKANSAQLYCGWGWAWQYRWVRAPIRKNVSGTIVPWFIWLLGNLPIEQCRGEIYETSQVIYRPLNPWNGPMCWHPISQS
jgi:hypothetical protein